MSVTKDIIDGVSSIIKDRIGHPFLGSFISTFLVCNYDILIDLAVNIEDPISVIFFKSALSQDCINRIGFPFFMMFCFPLVFQQFSRLIYAFISEKVNTIIEDIKETQNNKIHRVNAKNYQLKYESMESKIHNIVEKSMLINNFILDQIGSKSGSPEFLSIFESDENLRERQYVSIIGITNKIIPFNNSETFLGVVTNRISSNLYVVKCIPDSQLQTHFGHLVKDESNNSRDIILDESGIRIENGRGIENIRIIGRIDPFRRTVSLSLKKSNNNIFIDNTRKLLKNYLEK